MKKMRIFLSFLMVFILSGCRNNHIEQSESKHLIEGETTQTNLLTNNEMTPIIMPSDNVKETSPNDEFQAFIERWELNGLLPESRTMTLEQQDEFIKYFQQFDDVTQNYIILLLQEIAAGTTTLGNDINDHKYGVYLMYSQLALYDMNQDEFPELILKTGDSEASYMYTVYTVVDGKLINCGELSGSHSSLYSNGSGRFVRYEGHMGIYNIDVSTLEETTLITEKIADGVLDYSKEEDYPKLEKYGYGDYELPITFSDIPTLYLAPAG